MLIGLTRDGSHSALGVTVVQSHHALKVGSWIPVADPHA